ncbi:MFS transporter [Streptomyces sp. NPDC001508]|uniref:MFS transporter n=1 Tax=Streptomyces sp. NPDC001508 TaxID=3154656 RepID=UPI003325EAF6
MLDEAPTSMLHVKAAFTSGMGFFTDGYDLTIISTVLLLLVPQWGLSTVQIGLVGSATAFAAFFGSVIFGRLADIIGRKKLYGIEALIMVVGAILTALSPNFMWLLIFRLFLGIGIGGDYPVSATIMTEYANRKNRGRQVAMMFSSLAAGTIAGYIVALALLAAGVDHALAWRLMLGLGAIPACGVLYLRRSMPESPRYTANVVGDAKRAASELNGFAAGAVKAQSDADGVRMKLTFLQALSNRKFLITLLGTGGAWFSMNIAVNGNSLMQPSILAGLAPHASLAGVTAINLILAVLFNVTGLVCGVLLMDRVSRKGLLITGCTICIVAFLAIGFIPSITDNLVAFLVVFGLASFGNYLGPYAGIMVLSAESFPTSVRATGHGVSAGVGKLGAYVGSFFAPLVLAAFGLHITEIVAAACYGVAILFLFLVPEPAGRSLSELERSMLPSALRATKAPVTADSGVQA